MRLLHLYIRFILVYLRSKTEYGIYYFMDLVINFFWSFISIATIYIIMEKFDWIAGWSTFQVILLFSVNFFTSALASLFIRNPMREQEEMIRTGSFDSMLTKPIHPLVHMIIRQFSHGHLFQLMFSAGVMTLCFVKLDTCMSFFNTLMFFLAILTGTMIHASVAIFSGAMSFHFLKLSNSLDEFFHEMNQFIQYPISIYNGFVQFFLTFILPYAFVNFYPIQHILKVKDEVPFFDNIVYLAPLVALLGFALSLSFWLWGLQKYKSTGS